MRIALDYDQTYTRAPALWNAFMHNAAALNHIVDIVTMRNGDTEKIPDDVVKHANSVIYTNRVAKARYMAKLGYTVDIWIDDAPHFILGDANG